MKSVVLAKEVQYSDTKCDEHVRFAWILREKLGLEMISLSTLKKNVGYGEIILSGSLLQR